MCRDQIYEAKKKLKEANAANIDSKTEAKFDSFKGEPFKVGGEALTTATISGAKLEDINKPITIKPGMLPHDSMPVLGHSQAYYVPHHPGHNVMSRHSSFNYSYYHHAHYTNGNGVYPYHDPYHNENYYDGSLKKNKSASDLISSSEHYKETEFVQLFMKFKYLKIDFK